MTHWQPEGDLDEAATLEQLVSVARHASDEVVIASAVNRFAEAVGFRWFTYLSLGGKRPEAMSTYPAVWSDHYFAKPLRAGRPRGARLLAVRRPIHLGHEPECTAAVRRGGARVR